MKLQFFLYIFLITLFTFVDFLHAGQEINLANSGIRLSIPDRYSVKSSDISQAIFIARSEIDGLNLNIIENPGTKILGAGRQRAQEILDSYHSVGLTSARIVDTSAVKNKQGNAFFKSELKYESNSRKYTAYVALFNGVNRYYILTLIAPQSVRDSSLEFNQILDSISLDSRISNTESPSFPWFFLIIGLSVVIFVYFKQIRPKFKMTRSKKSENLIGS
ncbi:MAG: hypothetical protein R3A13_03335 [Bdellovibrionota bacterium]